MLFVRRLNVWFSCGASPRGSSVFRLGETFLAEEHVGPCTHVTVTMSSTIPLCADWLAWAHPHCWTFGRNTTEEDVTHSFDLGTSRPWVRASRYLVTLCTWCFNQVGKLLCGKAHGTTAEMVTYVTLLCFALLQLDLLHVQLVLQLLLRSL